METVPRQPVQNQEILSQAEAYPFTVIATPEQEALLGRVVDRLFDAQHGDFREVPRANKDGKMVERPMVLYRWDAGPDTYEAALDYLSGVDNSTFSVSIYRAQYTFGSSNIQKDAIRFGVWQSVGKRGNIGAHGLGSIKGAPVPVQWVDGVELRDAIERIVSKPNEATKQMSTTEAQHTAAQKLTEFEVGLQAVEQLPPRSHKKRLLGRIGLRGNQRPGSQ